MDYEKVKAAVLNQLGDFHRAEHGNRITPYNMAGLVNAISAVFDQEKQAEERGPR